jgi:phosphatidylserine decarboxylase
VVTHQKSVLCREGWPWLIATLAACGVVFRFWGPGWSAPFALLAVWLFFLFRDPGRDVPPLPLGVLSPVDGRIVEVSRSRDEALSGDWTRIVINATHLGAYTVRSPIEGTICDVREEAGHVGKKNGTIGLWVRSEERDDVVLLFPGRQPLFGPKTFVRYGERVGQGQRFAYLRLAPRAEVYLPASADVRVGVGDRVLAGAGILAELAEG